MRFPADPDKVRTIARNAFLENLMGDLQNKWGWSSGRSRIGQFVSPVSANEKKAVLKLFYFSKKGRFCFVSFGD